MKNNQGQPAVRPTPKDLCLCVFFLLCWTLPTLYTGLTLKKIQLFPSFVRYLQSIGNLFTHSVPVWAMPYIQVRLEGETAWRTLPEKEYFRLKTFGYRTRFFEILYFGTNIVDYERKTQDTRAQLAQWVAQRFRKLYPKSPAPVEVRFVAGLYVVDSQKPPQGHWKLIGLGSFREDQIDVLSTHAVR